MWDQKPSQWVKLEDVVPTKKQETLKTRPRHFFYKIRELFFVFLQCLQIEHVHN